MNLYKKSGWFSLIVSIILILRGVITSIFTINLEITTLIVASILPVILLYISICLIKAKDKRSSVTATSVIISAVSVLWSISLIPGVPIIITTIIIMANLLLLVVALLAINWYLRRVVGLVITLFILFIITIFVGAYGVSIRSSIESQISTTTQI